MVIWAQITGAVIILTASPSHVSTPDQEVVLLLVHTFPRFQLLSFVFLLSTSLSHSSAGAMATQEAEKRRNADKLLKQLKNYRRKSNATPKTSNKATKNISLAPSYANLSQETTQSRPIEEETTPRALAHSRTTNITKTTLQPPKPPCRMQNLARQASQNSRTSQIHHQGQGAGLTAHTVSRICTPSRRTRNARGLQP